ncbi:DHA2 family efflux MFS transporter permease subunit [Asticcacaulis machinosus]|uniref:DHA2 family efflux MFS transporter permease subunit n=1 Tax=Asticcacaulis machinosus TaxID=2984211 RepID=A0ABT5HKI3_9CAUL|nr:DHA2 family efflux MFS transporter permease subunit [Asticcacaulis machinosus]MDC7676692.1 DHA2 family efflux MFS transporter permease subunit [Asticcacaulis machinosus]
MASPATTAGAEPASPPPLTGGTLTITAIALALGTFMQVLDSTIANVSLPTIAGNLGVSSSQGTWVITSFAVANGISVPLTGWLMGRFGVVRVFTFSVLLFTFASFLCGIAWNIEGLIGFRILQGLVSGPMIPGSQALLIMIFPPEKRATGLAMWSMTTLVGPICGPILGGYISDNYAWEWIFLINVPIGLFCAFICWQNMKSRETPTRKVPVDTTGFALLVIWVGALQVMLDTGKEADWFSSPAIVVELIVAIVFFIAWVIWELNEKNPIVDLSMFKNRNFTLGTIALCIAYAIFFGNGLLLPVWLQSNMGYVATWAGLVAAPSGVVAVILTPFAARLLGKTDARILATFSILMFALSFFMRSGYTPDADFTALVLPLLVQGVAMSTFFISMITIAMADIPAHQTPAASGLSNFARITAGSFAASLATTIWDRMEAVHQTRLSETMSSGSPLWIETIQKLQAAGLSLQQAVGVITSQVMSQAYLQAALDFFRISGWLTLLLIPLIWFAKKSMSNGAVHAAD